MKALERQSKCYQYVALILKPITVVIQRYIAQEVLVWSFCSLPRFLDVYLLNFISMERLSHPNHGCIQTRQGVGGSGQTVSANRI